MSHEVPPSPAVTDLALAREFGCRLRQHLGGRAFNLVFFESRARGETDEESDLDLLIELQDDDIDGAVEDIVLAMARDLTLEHGILVAVLVADRTFREGYRGYGFLDAVQADGVPVLHEPAFRDG